MGHESSHHLFLFTLQSLQPSDPTQWLSTFQISKHTADTTGLLTPVVTNLFEPKIPDLRLHDGQDLPIEALRGNGGLDWIYDEAFYLA